ncbi:MAG: SMP-30/gluconolactonase/LRE family protein [Candidatus Latescibacteria bacterium]|nr:SMP-30/gluconolactonase/LRE family protein [Candidatus Latescibacterota bacterium]
MELELIADYKCETGEGPLWHPDEKVVYWLDIPPGRLFRYDPATGHHEQCFDLEGNSIGGFTIQTDGSLLLFMAEGAITIWRTGEFETVVKSIPGEEKSRFNDVMADAAGRVFCGTMPSPDKLGKLYKLDHDGTLSQVLDEIHCSNGMGFTPNQKQMYYTDSGARTIYRFDYDRNTSALTNQSVFVKTPDDDGVPDGMTVDAEGYVWCAKWDGHALVRYAPDGTEDRRIEFPTKKVSCVTFGGDDYTDMYVTTAGGHDKEENGEHAGALYRLNLGIKGVPEFRSNIQR